MHKRIVLQLIGRLLLVLAASMVVPLAVALIYRDGGDFWEIPAFLSSIGITCAAGALLASIPADLDRLSGREGFAVTTFGWIAISAFGALPLWLAGDAFPSYLDAFFESISGFTTTGASILSEIESLPHGILFWRSMTHWLGGMGIVVLTVAVLPSLGAAGFQLMRAEVPGPQTDRLRPKIAATAKLLWGVYVLLTLIEIVLLWFSEMDLFEATCHTFGTIATGGFSTRNTSVGAYHSAYIEWVITVFMLIGALNFVQHYGLFRGKPGAYWKSEETRWCVAIVVVSATLISIGLFIDGKSGSLHDIVRTAFFQVLTIISTTGYATVDFDTWPQWLRLLMFLLMFVGGSAGSTAGALKVFRLVLLWKVALRELKRVLRPRQVMALKLDGRVVDPSVISGVISVTTLYMLAFVVATLLIAAILPAGSNDLETSASAVAATLGCVGPGLGGIGPTCNYLWMPPAAKVILCICMLLGRLEVVTVLVLLAPRAWKQ